MRRTIWSAGKRQFELSVFREASAKTSFSTSLLKILAVRNAPNAARAVICNVQSAVVTYGYSYRSAPDLSIRSDKPCKKILILAGGSPIFHGNPDYLVAPRDSHDSTTRVQMRIRHRRIGMGTWIDW
jgi:hypothetical protein